MTGTHQFVDLQCPYCGEWIDVALDPSVDVQQYVEDCQVCCQPILLDVTVDADGQVALAARREGEN
mgnify:CR=1 FL=1